MTSVTANAAMPLLVIASSLIAGLAIFFLPEERVRWRSALNITAALIKLALVAAMLWGVANGREYEARFALLPGIDLMIRADAMAMLFVALSALLWLLTTIYAIGYLEGSPHRSRFFGFFSLCVTSTMGIALAGNLLTFFLFYEMLTLSTYPLVAHRGTAKALRAANVYLTYTLAGGAVLLVGVVWLYSLLGNVDFTQGGMMRALSRDAHPQLAMIFVLLIAGLGVKAALVPLHGWLPVAMAAPAPVSALLHAVAVVKAGAFGIVRIVYDVYGVGFAASMGLLWPLALVAAITMIYGSLRALMQDDLKRRLAFSTVSQVAYIVLGVGLFGPLGSVGGLVHLVHQGIMKITLFFCAGNYAETLGLHKVSELNGIGRRMPLTTAAFTAAAFGMIGVPPTAGFITKWYLGLGATEAEMPWVIALLALSSVLNAAYFLPIVYAAWFKSPSDRWPQEARHGRFETDGRLLWPAAATGVLTIAAGLLAGTAMSPLNWAKFIMQLEYLQ